MRHRASALQRLALDERARHRRSGRRRQRGAIAVAGLIAVAVTVTSRSIAT